MPLRGGRQTASVLVVVLIVCLGLVSITLLFGHSMLMAYRGEDNDLAALQAQNAIDGAIRYTESLMAATDTSNSATTVTNALPTLTNNATSSGVATAGVMPDSTLYQSEAVPVGAAEFWFIGEPPVTGQANLNSGVSAISSSASGGIAGATDQPVFGLVDEASKLNLNRASYAMLMLLPGMTDDLANAIVAWRTLAGEQNTGTSSVSGGTNLLEGGVKGAPFESVEELAQVNGGTDLTALYGNDTNLNHCLDAAEQINGLAQLTPGLLEYVTVFSRECNLLSDGTKRVNISTPAQSSGLKTLLTNTLGATRAGQIMSNFRNIGPGRPATVGSALEFYSRIPDITSAEMDQIGDRLTVTSGAYTTGMVNVNTASVTVLACIPGLSDKAAQIVATRQTQTQPLTNFFWVLPLLKGSTTAQTAGPYLTAHSYQISADIAAVGRHGRGYRRTRVVIDNTGPAPQVVYRRDLTPLGWALGSTVRQNLVKIADANPNAEAAAR